MTGKEQKEEIKRLYALEENKNELQELLAEKYNLEANSVRNHWFGRLVAVPKKHREEVIKIMTERTSVKQAS